MKSTGEVMGIHEEFPIAFAKSQVAGFGPLPTKGTVFISVKDTDKDHIVPAVEKMVERTLALLRATLHDDRTRSRR